MLKAQLVDFQNPLLVLGLERFIQMVVWRAQGA